MKDAQQQRKPPTSYEDLTVIPLLEFSYLFNSAKVLALGR